MNTIDLKQVEAVQKASGHSVYGPSTMPRIIDCPASVIEELKAGLQASSPAAERGSILHAWAERAMESARAREFIISQNLDLEDTSQLLDAIDYVHAVLALHTGPYTITLESKGDLAAYGLPEVYGTKDVCISSAARVDVIDYKFGFIPVHAENNYQNVCYLGMEVPFADVIEDRKFFTHICQPSRDLFTDWEVSRNQLNQMILGDITDAIENARSANPRFGPSEKACRFCKAKSGCKHYHNSIKEQAALVQRMSQDPSKVPTEEWSKLFKRKSEIMAAFSFMEKYAYERLLSGKGFDGFKLIAGRGMRKFRDSKKGEEFIKHRLGAKAFKPREVISLAQAEKFDTSLKKSDEFKKLWHKPEGKAKLVKESHTSPALNFGPTSVFDEIAAKDAEK